MKDKTKKNAPVVDARLAELIKTETRAQEKFDEVSARLDKATNVESRSWTPEETVELDEASKFLSHVRSEIKAEATRQAENKAALEARDAALGATGNVGGALIKNGVDNMTYSNANPDNSWYRDVLMSHGGYRGSRAAQKRLENHEQEMENVLRRAEHGTKEYRAVSRLFQENRRFASGPGVETRETIVNGGPSISSSGSPNDMAPFSPPIFFLPEYATYRTYGRTYIDQLSTFPLPATGMSYFVPKITTPTQAYNQATEGASISTQDLASEYESGTLYTLVNNLNVSQQYLDRVGPGIAGDQIVNRDQTAQLNRALNVYAWQNTLQNSSIGTQADTDTTSTYSGWATFNGPSVAAYRSAVAKGSIAIQTTDGIVAYPTHFFTDAQLWETVAAAYDENYRPFVVPQGVAFNPLFTGTDASVPEGYTGYSFGGVSAFKDQALQVAAALLTYAGAGVSGNGSAAFDADSGNHLGVIGAFDLALKWMEGTPVLRVLPQPGAATLTVLIQQYVYCALVPVYPGAVQVVSSKGTASSIINTLL
jgi:hypothetical protein